MKKSILFSLAALLVAYCSIAQNQVDKTFSGIEEIDMNVGSGDAIFERSSSGNVEVSVEYYSDNYKPIMEKRGKTLVIEEEQKRGSWKGNSSTWTIKIPDGMEIDFNTGSGDVELSGLSVRYADMNSGSGDFRMETIKGEFKLNTGSGDLDARDCEGELRLNSGSGDIDLKDIEGEIKANVGSGEVTALEIILTGGSTFNSGSGDVEVELAKSPAYDLSVNSGSGDAKIDFNGNKMNGILIMEVNKRSGRIRAPFNFDKEEEIDKGWNTVMRKSKKFNDEDVQIKVSSGSGVASVQNP